MMNHILNIDEQNFVFIGESSELTGNFSFYGNTKVAGTIDGEVNMQDKSPLYIEPHGKVTGNIECHDITIHGKVHGKIHATGTLTVHPFAEVSGEISAKGLNFMANAIINTDAKTHKSV